MARKKKPEEHENHERWLVSYADFITLLFAFFVVMYALSSVNEGKYRVLSDSLIAAFRNPPKSLAPIQVGSPVIETKDIKQDVKDPTAIQAIKMPIQQQKEVKSATGKVQKSQEQRDNMKKMASQISQTLANMVANDKLSVKRKDNSIEVEINSSVLFESGSALLTPRAIPILTKVAEIVKDFPNAIRVEGFTDDIPIDTDLFPSNWELSANRAASVVHLLSDQGVDPFRLAALGYGEHRPLVLNDSPEGREKNRRIAIIILDSTADELYDRSRIEALKIAKERQKNIDLDLPMDVIEEIQSPTKTDEPIPEGFPKELNLNKRRNLPENPDGEENLTIIVDEIGNEGGGGSQ